MESQLLVLQMILLIECTPIFLGSSYTLTHIQACSSFPPDPLFDLSACGGVLAFVRLDVYKKIRCDMYILRYWCGAGSKLIAI